MSSVSASSGGDAAASAAAGEGVWSALLGKSSRKSKESNSTLVFMGDKRCGKSALLSKFSDRVSSDILSSLSNTGSSLGSGAGGAGGASSASSLLASSVGCADYTLDFSYAAVKNRYGASAVDKDEPLARINIWQLDEPAHAGLIPTLLQTGQGGGGATPAASVTPAPSSSSSSSSSSATSAASSLSSSSPLDYAALDSAVFVVSFDLSEPWRALESVQTWLAALSKVITPALAALPEAQARALRNKISKYTQSYYDAPPTNSESASIGDSASTNDSASSPTNAATSPLSATSPASLFLSSSSSSSTDVTSGGLPIDPAIPAFNLGVPIIVVGLKGDSFGRHVGARGGAGAAGGASAPSGAGAAGSGGSSDEKFDFLTRKLRKLCMEWGATLVYTSVAHMATGGRSSQSSKEAGGVNVEVLQHYILHRLYRFPLNPVAADAAAAVAALDASSPSAAAAASDSKVNSAAQAAAKSAQALAAKFNPRLIGSAEDDFGIYVPAGYDSENLLDTTSKNAVSAAYGDATPVEEVLKNPYVSRKNAAAQRGGQQQQFDTVSAEDNTVFFKNLKYQLEQGGGVGIPLSLGAVSASGSSSNTPSSRSSTGATSTPKITPSPTHAHTNSTGAVVSPSSGLTAEQKAAAGGSSAAAAAAAAKAGGGAAPVPAVKGQIAVKQFFRSLLNNTSKPDANSKAAAQQKAVRANAEKELQRMTNEGGQ